MQYHKEITCPEEWKNETKYLPDPYDCTKYYVCTHGGPVPIICPTDNSTGTTLWWDSRNETCTLPEDSDCQGTLYLTNTKNINHERFIL